MTETKTKTKPEPMTAQEATQKILGTYRKNPFFSEIDYSKLIRELFPNASKSIFGVGLKAVKDRCEAMYDQIWETYDKLPDDQKMDREVFFAESLKDGRKNGYVELIKVLELLYIANNKPNK